MAVKSFIFSAQNLAGDGPESGALTFVTRRGTSTPVVVYLDSGLTTPAANPQVSDAVGTCGPLYFDDTVLDEITFTVTTANRATILLEVDYRDGVFSIVQIDPGQIGTGEFEFISDASTLVYTLPGIVISSPYNILFTTDLFIQPVNGGTYSVTTDGTDTTVTLVQAYPFGTRLTFRAFAFQGLQGPAGDFADVDGYTAAVALQSTDTFGIRRGGVNYKITAQVAILDAIDELRAAAPAALDTLEELADALGDDANFASTVTTSLAGKQPISDNLTSWATVARAENFDAFVLSATSANLRALLTDETGTGAAVFGTSPTITQPVINNTLGGYDTTATAAGTTTLTVASMRRQFFTGTTTQTVILPVVTTLALGHTFEIFNNSTGAVTVNSSGGNAVVVVPPGGKAEVVCILITGTTAASWTVNAMVAPTQTVFTASGTWTKPARCTAIIVEIRGGGGGGGGVSNAAAFKAGGGGAEGGYSRKRIAGAVLGATETVTVGAGGTAGATTGAQAGTGGTTSFGAHCSANGGVGGYGATTAGATACQAGGDATGGDFNRRGAAGNCGIGVALLCAMSGSGGGAGGGYGVASTFSNQPGTLGVSGGGGSGAISVDGTANVGGAGGAGYVIVTEFYS